MARSLEIGSLADYSSETEFNGDPGKAASQKFPLGGI
jgi:hypothetical protein